MHETRLADESSAVFEPRQAWPTMGIANVITDNLIAQGKSKSMIVVMPNANWSELASGIFVGPRTTLPPGVGGVGSGGGAILQNVV